MARTNANGLVSYGKDLSSLNKFTSAFTGGYELTDIKSAFQSNDLEGAYQNGSNTISTDESKYTLPDGATPSNVGGKYTMDGVDTCYSAILVIRLVTNPCLEPLVETLVTPRTAPLLSQM